MEDRAQAFSLPLPHAARYPPPMQAVIYIFRCPKGRVYAGWRGVSPEALRRWPHRGYGPLPCGYIGSGVIWDKVARKHRDALVWRILARLDGSRADVDAAERRAIRLVRHLWGEMCVNVADGGQGQTREAALQLASDPAWLAKVSDGTREAMNRPDVKARHLAAIQEMTASSEWRARVSAAQREAQNRPEVRARNSSIQQALWADPEVRSARQEALCIVMAQVQARPEVRAKISASVAGYAATPEGLEARARAVTASKSPEAVAKRVRSRRVNDSWRVLAERHPEWWVPHA